MKRLAFFQISAASGGQKVEIDVATFDDLFRQAKDFEFFLGVSGTTVLCHRRAVLADAPSKPTRLERPSRADALALLRVIRSGRWLTPTEACGTTVPSHARQEQREAILKNARLHLETARAAVDCQVRRGVWLSFEQGEARDGQRTWRFRPGVAAEKEGVAPVALNWCVVFAEEVEERFGPNVRPLPLLVADPHYVGFRAQTRRLGFTFRDAVIDARTQEAVILYALTNTETWMPRLSSIQLRFGPHTTARDSQHLGPRISDPAHPVQRVELADAIGESSRAASLAFDVAAIWDAMDGAEVVEGELQIFCGSDGWLNERLMFRVFSG